MNEEKVSPLAAWFLGPKAEHGTTWSRIINYIFQDYIHWRRNYFPEDQVVVDRSRRRKLEDWFDLLNTNIDQLLSHLKADYPFYSPRYLAHMLSEQSLPSVAGYLAGMLYNPNNVTPEAAPITVDLELEVGKIIAEMLGFDKDKSFAHLCSGGTIANLESMWVARMVIAVPIIIQSFCRKYDIHFQVKLTNQKKKDIRDIHAYKLMQMIPDEVLKMPRSFLKHITLVRNDSEDLIREFNHFYNHSKYNINANGWTGMLSDFSIEPVILVSEAIHYCFHKIANLLGIGKNAVISIPVDSEFRMSMDAFREKLFELKENQIVVAAVGIVGTTEEGAIDPVHKMYDIRRELEILKQRSFWFHIDAAWGGYLRSMLFQKREGGAYISLDINKGKEKIYDEYFELKSIEEKFEMNEEVMDIDWKDRDLFYSLLYMSKADSITIDPHKLGYIPYPSGVICFQNSLSTELLVQEAPYIYDDKAEFESEREFPIIDKVGPYVIEGSKPGAAAASAWLAHKSIPLDNHNHGKLMRTSILNTRKLYTYLVNHLRFWDQFEQGEGSLQNENELAFTFKPICEPDSNILCYVALPYKWQNGELMKASVPLKFINDLNQKIYEKFSMETHDKKHKMPYGQEYFISRTRLTHSTYKAESIKFLLDEFGIGIEEYKKEGVFVLRSTIMNPWYYLASVSGDKTDYLMKFLKKLHKETKFILQNMQTH